MSSNGRRWAALLGVLIAFALPKHVECAYPGAAPCQHQARWRMMCTGYEVEPFGFFLLELAFARDIGFAYTTGEDCR